jgi:hypothetical protein
MALRIQARDLVQPAFPLRLVSDGEREVSTAGFAGHDQVGDAEFGAVGGHPSDSGRAVVETGGERVRAELAAGVAEFHPDDDKPCGGEVFAQPQVPGVGGGTDRHATAVQMHDRGDRTVDAVGTADEECDVVAVVAGYGGRRRGDTRGCGRPLREDIEDRAHAFFAHRGEGQSLFERRIDRQRYRRHSAVEPELGERLDHSRVGARVGREGGIWVGVTSVSHGADRTTRPCVAAGVSVSPPR